MARILITGGCGFIGRHVAEELLAHGHEVRLYDAMIDQVHGVAKVQLPEGAEVIRGDMRDADRLPPRSRAATASSTSPPRWAWARACTRSPAMSAPTTSAPPSSSRR
jgi:nucleoside-diphosphate-sugar epimerase